MRMSYRNRLITLARIGMRLSGVYVLLLMGGCAESDHDPQVEAWDPEIQHGAGTQGEGTSRMIPDLGMELVWVPPGRFEMGDNQHKWERPVRTVAITKGYWMGKTEVTQAQYGAVARFIVSWFEGANLPAEFVSWYDAVRYCELLTEREHQAGRLPEGYVYRLPTEAEWEYAARGGRQGRDTIYSGSDNLDEVAWHTGNSGGRTYPVGTKAANELGLYDMSGNVSEWVHDWYQSSYRGLGTADPTGPASGSERVHRGGSWAHHGACRVADRDRRAPGIAIPYIGFRVVLGPPL